MEMSEGLVRNILTIAVPAVIFGLAAAVSYGLKRNKKLVTLGVASGHTAPSGLVMVAAAMSGAFVILPGYALLGAGAGTDPDQALPLYGLILGFGLGVVLMTVMSVHRWRWSEEGLTFRGAFKSVTLRWSELEVARPSWQGGWLARDRDGRKIHWSHEYTIGGDVITAAVAHYRPDLVALA